SLAHRSSPPPSAAEVSGQAHQGSDGNCVAKVGGRYRVGISFSRSRLARLRRPTVGLRITIAPSWGGASIITKMKSKGTARESLGVARSCPYWSRLPAIPINAILTANAAAATGNGQFN